MDPTAFDNLQTPALLIRLDRVRANIARAIADAGIDRWRPHIKTSKVGQVMDLLLQAGVRHFKCATTREAAVLLARAEAPVDLLVAYAHRGANLRRIAALAKEHPQHRLSVLTEESGHAQEVRHAAPRVGLFVDLDPGYHRTGIPLAERDRLRQTLGVCEGALAGVHFYDGHVLEETPEDRAAHCGRIYGELLRVLAELELEPREIITSGTPTYRQALAFDGFSGLSHRVSPGTIVYSDLRTEQLGVDGFARAVHVLSRVVSSTGGDRVTCDAGSKAIDAAAGDPCAEVEGWPSLTPQTPSEEHLPLHVDAEPAPAPGTLIQLAPLHVCPTVNLADEAVLVEDDALIDIVPVSARGHETR